MKAMLCLGYKSLDYLQLTEVDLPTIDKNELLIQVKCTSVQIADWRVQNLEMPEGMGVLAKLIFGFSKPRNPILGTEVSGIVKEVGANVTNFQVGDEVIAVLGAKFGGHAEYIKVRENSLVIEKPKNMNFKEAACLSFGGLTALDYLKYKAKVQSGEHVLINGASGSVGLASIQIAKYLGAKVTAVCSEKKNSLVRSLGADYTLDYNKEDFWSSKKYDVVFDTVGKLRIPEGLSCLNKNGRLVLVAADLKQMVFGKARTIASDKKIVMGVATESKSLLSELIMIYESGHYKTVIDREYSLSELPQAFSYTGKHNKSGNLVVNVS